MIYLNPLGQNVLLQNIPDFLISLDYENRDNFFFLHRILAGLSKSTQSMFLPEHLKNESFS